LLWNVFLVYKLATDLRMNDFGRFYYSARAFLHGQDMYGPRPVEVAQTSELGGQQFGNMNPPHFHLLLFPFTLFSPLVALCLWGAASFLCLWISLRVIAREISFSLPTRRQWWFMVIGALGFTGTNMILVTGQLSWLLLLPITLAWARARQGGWIQAGAYLGFCIGLKPFLLIFAPYLVIRRQFHAVGSMCVTIAVSFTLGLLVFGIDAHASWIRELTAIHWLSANTNASLLGFLTRILTESLPFSPLVVAPGIVKPLWALIAGVVGLLTLAPAFFT
jgi:hypothetical protein